jgi:hypothetical protein
MSSTHENATDSGREARESTTTTVSQRAEDDTRYQAYQVGSLIGSPAGLTALAGWLLMLGGLWSFFIGLGVLVQPAYFTSLPGYVPVTHYAYQWNLSGWGWLNLILGIAVVATGASVLLGQTWARWAGVILAVLSGIANFLFIPYFPIWSVLVIALDVFIVWALVTARRRQDV